MTKPAARQKLYRNGFYAMATRFFMLIPDVDESTGDLLFQRIRQETDRIESKLSRFIAESELTRINRNAGRGTVKTDEEMFEILEACRYMSERTGGAFDITLRPLTEYWGRGGSGQTEDDLEKLKSMTGYQKVNLQPEMRGVSFEEERVELDLGGFGKGYALENVNTILQKNSVSGAFITFGESSILALGEHPAGGAWKVGIRNLRDPAASIHEFQVSGGSVSTSSNIRLDDEDNLHHRKHVINPKTARPVENMKSVSVSAPSPILAEMFSTAALAMEDEEITELMQEYDDVEVIRVDYSSKEPDLMHLQTESMTE